VSKLRTMAFQLVEYIKMKVIQSALYCECLLFVAPRPPRPQYPPQCFVSAMTSCRQQMRALHAIFFGTDVISQLRSRDLSEVCEYVFLSTPHYIASVGLSYSSNITVLYYQCFCLLCMCTRACAR